MFLPFSVRSAVAIFLVLLLSTHHHNVLGVHNDVLVAFQYSYCGNRRYISNKPTRYVNYISSSQLRYSSDEDGIVSTNWLHQQSNTPSINKQNLDGLQSGDDVNTELDDHNSSTLNDIIEDDNNSVIDDSWTNDTKERRIRRIQSLDKFNSKQKTNTLQSDGSSSRDEERKPPEEHPIESSNILGLPYNDMSQLQAIQSNAPAILLPSGPG